MSFNKRNSGFEFFPKILLFAAISLAVLDAASAQAAASINIDLGVFVDTVSPGDKVNLPITLATSEGSKVRKLLIEVAFPSKELTLVEVRRGPAAEAADGKIETQVAEGTAEEKMLSIALVAPKPIPQGEIATLIFEISKHVRMDKEIKVRNLKRTASGADGQSIESYGIDGSITALTPMSACFFYMH